MLFQEVSGLDAQSEEIKYRHGDSPEFSTIKMPGMKKDAKIEVTSSEEKETISGFACNKYDVKEDGKDFMSIWTTGEITGYGGMKADMKEFSRRLAALIPMPLLPTTKFTNIIRNTIHRKTAAAPSVIA